MSLTAEKLNGQAAAPPWTAGLRCPYCGQADTLHLSLQSLDLSCDNEECGEVFRPADVRHILEQWAELTRRLAALARAKAEG